MTKLTDLSQPELDVLLLLTSARETSVVSLAADVWRTTPDWRSFDPYPLLTYILDSLSSRGLVRFRLASQYGRRDVDMPHDIRLTPLGWSLAGYPNLTVEVGSRYRHSAPVAHTGDMTIYRNHSFRAQGGAIEVEDFPTHRTHYPHHVHMYGEPMTMANLSAGAKRTKRLADPRIMDATNEAGERGYIRVTPDMEAEVISTRDRMGTVGYADIAKETGLPERTIRYVLTDLPRLRRAKAGEDSAQGSLKGRIYEAVRVLGHIKDVAEVRRIVGMADSEHDVMHVLHSLHTQGRIDFDERGNGMGTATVVNIRLPKKQSKVRPSPAPEAESEIPTIELAEPEATTQETPLTAPSAPEPDKREAYPLLDALLDRERKRLDVDNKAMAYVTAAEAIKDVDPDEAVRMMRKAEALDVPFPSPIEREYLTYVAAHPHPITEDNT